jgi:hypothetical protein
MATTYSFCLDIINLRIFPIELSLLFLRFSDYIVNTLLNRIKQLIFVMKIRDVFSNTARDDF